VDLGAIVRMIHVLQRKLLETAFPIISDELLEKDSDDVFLKGFSCFRVSTKFSHFSSKEAV